MRLVSLDYSEHVTEPQEWRLSGLSLGQRNLVVGRNAAGKSRVLNIIHGLAQHLLGLRPPSMSGTYDAQFEDAGRDVRYQLTFIDQEITAEVLSIAGKELLNRRKGGYGTIHAEQLNQPLSFQSPANVPAATARRDYIQHPFLELLHSWASSTRYYQFGSPLGKDRLAVFVQMAGTVDERDQNQVVGILRNGLRDFGEKFRVAVQDDMNAVGYSVERLELAPPISITFPIEQQLPAPPMSICVKESDLPGITDQISMSQGMYRVLALLIHLNYLLKRGSASCLLIDDIGEGLDFDRSCKLISLVRRKATSSSLQVILTSNDRFVMNEVPLEEWTILKRKSNHVNVVNRYNSGALFEELRFTGMSNSALMELGLLDEALH